MGRGYAIDFCVSSLNLQRQEENYRVYLTEVLRAIAKCVGCKISYSYADMLAESKPNKKEEQTPDEIISNIKGRLEAMTNGLK